MLRRFSYPFVPSIARQLSVTAPTVQTVISLQGVSGWFTPFIAPIAERYQRKHVMIVGLLILVVAGVWLSLQPSLWVFGITFFLFGLGKVIYDPAMYAYIGDHVPYRRRGLALGFGELSWALSLLIIAPIAGVLLSRSDLNPITVMMLDYAASGNYADLLVTSSGFQNTILLMVFFCVIGIGLIVWFVPGYERNPIDLPDLSIKQMRQVLRQNPAALAVVGYAFFLSMGNEMIFINYGLFMEASFALTVTVLGLLTVIISAAEVLGEVAVMALSDAIGKRVMTLVAGTLAALSYIILPLSSFSLPAALIVLFLMFFCTEIAIVASIPIFTEVLPSHRILIVSLAGGGSAVGRVAGGLAGGLFFGLFGDFIPIGLIAACVGLISVFMMWRYVDLA